MILCFLNYTSALISILSLRLEFGRIGSKSWLCLQLLQIGQVPIGCKTRSWTKVFPVKCRVQREEFGWSPPNFTFVTLQLLSFHMGLRCFKCVNVDLLPSGVSTDLIEFFQFLVVEAYNNCLNI